MAPGQGTRQLAPGEFYGGARLERCAGAVRVSQRIAEGAPESIAWHRHADAHFILVHAGSYVSLASGAGEPRLIYNPPGTTHRDHFRDGRGSYSAISLAPASAAAALAPLRTPGEPCRLSAPAQGVLARRIVAQCAAPSCALTLESLVLELLGSLDPRAPGHARRAPGWLAGALELLADTFAQELTLLEVAQAVGVHPVHLTRTFRRHLHCTPGAWVRYRRLDCAAGLLAQGSQPLAEVALASGFADQSHFTHSFGRAFGVSPAAYRRLAGGARRGGFVFDKTAAQLRATVARVRSARNGRAA